MSQVMGFKLSSGAVMPPIGVGIGTKDDRVVDGILSAIEVGYRCFDTAREYGTEPLLGEALAKAVKAGLVRREDVFVTTKLRFVDTNPSEVVTDLKNSLSDLQLEYVDLFLVHWPFRAKKTFSWENIKPGDFETIDQLEVWKSMESCVEAGLTKSIGVSNWTVKKLEELLAHARIPPAVLQVEVHPLWRQDKLREYCRQNGIVVTAYSPLGAPGSYYGSNNVITNPTITEIAQGTNQTPAQVILRWLNEKGVSFVVRSYNKSRLEENLNALKCSLSVDDIEKLDNIAEQNRVVTGYWFIDPENGPFKSGKDLWDE